MIHSAIKLIVRTKFALTSTNKATKQIHQSHDKYLKLAGSIDIPGGAQAIRVPPMAGIDEDMRNWSFFMIIEHNTIVNQRITNIVKRLVRGEDPAGNTHFDPKKDVMPSDKPGTEQLPVFYQSVEAHHQAVKTLGSLGGNTTHRHPLFGEFNARYWHCMFAFHLQIHYKQARHVVGQVKAKQAL